MALGCLNTKCLNHLQIFAELKGFIKRNWGIYEGNPDQGFDAFLGRCIDSVGAN